MLTNKYIDVDVFECIEQFNQMLEDLRETGAYKLANFFEYIVEEGMAGNKLPMILFVMLLHMIPILNIFLLVDRIKKLLNRDEEES